MNTTEKVFSEIYTNGLWSPNPWNSGPGSDPDGEGKEYCQLITAILQARGAYNILDIGCGDGRIIHRVSETLKSFKRNVNIYASDCCEEVITTCKATFEAARLKFFVCDYSDPEVLHCVRNADTILAKDVFHHWPTEKIRWFMFYLRSLNENKTLIVTADNHQEEDGQDCELGGYRALSGSMKPWKDYQPTLLASYLHKSIWMVQFYKRGS